MKTLVELNREIKELETQLEDLKLQRMFLEGKRGRIFFKGNSYASRRNSERILRNARLFGPFRWTDKHILEKASVFKATKGKTDDVQKIETYEEWKETGTIYFDLVKGYLKNAEHFLEKEAES